MAKNGEKEVLCTIEGHGVRAVQLGGDPAWNCWGSRVGNSLIMRHRVIDTQEQALNLLKAAQEFSAPLPHLRMASFQLGLPEREWDQVTSEHILLSWLVHSQGLSFQAAHLSFPMQPLYTLKGVLPPSEFLLKTMAPLPRLLNSEGWEVYCFWLHEEMERILETFSLESMDIYTLQALLLDFVHEVRSSLLLSNEAEVSETLLKLGALRGLIDSPQKGIVDVVALEKLLVKRRNEAYEGLKVQYETLVKIVSTIESIESSHPNLVRFKGQAHILSLLLGAQLTQPLGWVQRLILLQLLNDELGIISTVSSYTGFDRTSIAFSVLMATALLRQEKTFEQVTSLAMNWNQPDTEQAELKERFKRLFLELIERLCIPLTASMTQVQEIEFAQDKNPSSELLELFPVKGNALDKKGHFLLTKLTALRE